MDEIRIDKKMDGILEVRDESDKDGLRIVVDLKKEANAENILNYFYKNTELQVSYNFNNVVIVNRRPMLLGILGILDAYIAHQKEVVTRRSEFDLRTAKARYHIVEGLIKAISILDEVIKTIRSSKNKANAIENLVKEYDFTEKQADAIVTLQLYRLTNTDIVSLQEEMEKLLDTMKKLEAILGDEKVLIKVLKKELKEIKDKYATPRKTEIRDEITEIKIDATSMIPKEDVMVVVTNEGYIKRTSLRSYAASNIEDLTLKEKDYIVGLYNMNTLDTLLVFTNLGNYLYIPVYEIPDLKWKDMGKHMSNIITVDPDEYVVNAMPVYDFDQNLYITSFTRNGMVKRTLLKEFKVSRYSKAINMMKLKDKDEVVNVTYSVDTNVLVVTKKGYGLWYKTSDINPVGIKASGVKSINLRDDEVVSGLLFPNDSEYITLFTDKGTAKRMRFSEIDMGTRGNRGLLFMKEIKSNPSHIIDAYVEDVKTEVVVVTKKYEKEMKIVDIPIMDRYSNGSFVVKDKIKDTHLKVQELSKDALNSLEYVEEAKPEQEQLSFDMLNKESLKEVDDRMVIINNFLDDVEGK